MAIDDSVWPPRWTAPVPKPTRTERKRGQASIRRTRKTAEEQQKGGAKARDGYRCRFPLCGCRTKSYGVMAFPEASHDQHKGAGGNPKGDRSKAPLLMTLCHWRHQEAPVSRHKGTLRAVYLTDAKNNGPVAWEVKREAISPHVLAQVRCFVQDEWLRVATEKDVQKLEPLEPWQARLLAVLARMQL